MTELKIELFRPADKTSSIQVAGLKFTDGSKKTVTIVPGFHFWDRVSEQEVQIVAIANAELDSSYWQVVYRPIDKPMAIATLGARDFLSSFKENESQGSSGYSVKVIEMLACERISIEPIHGGLYLNWSAAGVGFGQLSLSVNEEGKYVFHNEGMGKNFIKSILCRLVDEGELDC